MTKCQTCSGTGKVNPVELTNCSNCVGTGRTVNPDLFKQPVTCIVCGGSGRRYENVYRDCEHCRGTGQIPDESRPPAHSTSTTKLGKLYKLPAVIAGLTTFVLLYGQAGETPGLATIAGLLAAGITARFFPILVFIGFAASLFWYVNNSTETHTAIDESSLSANAPEPNEAANADAINTTLGQLQKIALNPAPFIALNYYLPRKHGNIVSVHGCEAPLKDGYCIDDSILAGYSLTDGKRIYRIKIAGVTQHYGYGAPVVDDEVAIFSLYESIVIISLSDGSIRNKIYLPDLSFVIAGSAEGKLVAYAARNELVLHNWERNIEIVRLLVSGSAKGVFSRNGSLFAYSDDDNKIQLIRAKNDSAPELLKDGNRGIYDGITFYTLPSTGHLVAATATNFSVVRFEDKWEELYSGKKRPYSNMCGMNNELMGFSVKNFIAGQMHPDIVIFSVSSLSASKSFAVNGATDALNLECLGSSPSGNILYVTSRNWPSEENSQLYKILVAVE